MGPSEGPRSEFSSSAAFSSSVFSSSVSCIMTELILLGPARLDNRVETTRRVGADLLGGFL